jgi:hypothetical protein
MDRRQFLQHTAAAGAVLGLPSGIAAATSDQQKPASAPASTSP